MDAVNSAKLKKYLGESKGFICLMIQDKETCDDEYPLSICLLRKVK